MPHRSYLTLGGYKLEWEVGVLYRGNYINQGRETKTQLYILRTQVEIVRQGLRRVKVGSYERSDHRWCYELNVFFIQLTLMNFNT